MMRKRGESLPFEEGTKAIIAFIVLAIVIFGVVTFLIGSKLSGSGNLLQSVKNILPSFGNQPAIAPGVAIVGIKLEPIDYRESIPFFSDDPLIKAAQLHPLGLVNRGWQWVILKWGSSGKPGHYYSSEGAVIRPSALAYYLSGNKNLSYYTGTTWIEIGKGEMRIEQKTLDSVAVRDALARFYFSTPRIGRPVFGLEDNRQMMVYIPSSQDSLKDNTFNGKGSLSLLYGVREGYAGDPRQSRLYFALDDKFYGDYDLNDAVSRSTSERDRLVAWRDQFLSGGPCQKTIELSFKQGDSFETHRYLVVKVARPDGFYAYVDLNAPIDGRGDLEKYGDDCFVDGSIISSDAANVVNTGSVYLSFVNQNDKRFHYEVFWMPLSNGLGKWYFVHDNDLSGTCRGWEYVKKGCSRVTLNDLEAQNFYLGLKAILDSDFSKELLVSINIIPNMAPAYYDDGSDYYDVPASAPRILSRGISVYQVDKPARYDSESLSNAVANAYNMQARAPSNYYAYPYRYQYPTDDQGGYYRFYFETTELPLFVGHNITGLQIYYASDSFNAAASFPRWDDAAGLTKVGSLNDIGNGNYQISMLSDVPADVPEDLKIHLHNLNGVSLNDLIFERVNYP